MEQKESNQFVILPNEVVDCENISPKSLVVYCAIKRHMNKETLEAFPSIPTIAKKSGCGLDVVRKAIKELVSQGFIELIKRPGQSTIYKFSKTKSFEPFSYDFLDNDKIKIREKAYLIMQQKNMFKNNGIGTTSYTTKEIAKLTRMSVPTVLACENTLIKAGYLTKPESKLIDKESGVHENLRLYLLELYNMAAITYQQTQQNTKDIEDLQDKYENAMKQIEILKRQVFKEESEDAIII
jgi:hypothetical protein